MKQAVQKAIEYLSSLSPKDLLEFLVALGAVVIGVYKILLFGIDHIINPIVKFAVQKVIQYYTKLVVNLKNWRERKHLERVTKELEERISNEALKSAEGMTRWAILYEIHRLVTMRGSSHGTSTATGTLTIKKNPFDI